MKRVGIDIGGTFTDFFVWDDQTGEMATLKVPSTPADPSEAGIHGLRKLLDSGVITAEDVGLLFHGTTVATNIILEHNGAKVGLITTEGFRDVLHIGRKDRPLNFSNHQDVARQSRPIVPRRYRMPVKGRISSDGKEVMPLDEGAVRAAANYLLEEGVEAVAVAFLFSFMNPGHERRAGEILREVNPAWHISLSHEVVPLYREYERFSTTALNAYVGPKTSSYIDRFTRHLEREGIGADLMLMSSGGGAVDASRACSHPVSLLLSGPVGALLAGVEIGRQVGNSNVITLDVGGTSADIGVAADGEVRMKHLLDTQIGEYDAMVPMADIDTIGSGGGSIAYVDEGGMFRVGPRSAGATPGPVCYGKGGVEPTVTDALATLGLFRAEALVDSGLQMQPDAARNAVEKYIAGPLGMGVEQAAYGIYRVAMTSMVEAIRVNSVAKGFDPRDFALLAFGGAGAAFAVEVGRELNVERVIVPRHPGVGAASGLLASDIKYEHMATVWQELSAPDMDAIAEIYRELGERARQEIRRVESSVDGISLQLKADCRYRGQGYELTVAVPADPSDPSWLEQVIESFHAEHQRAYLRRFNDKAVQLINARVIVAGHVPRIESMALAKGDGEVSRARRALEMAWFSVNGEMCQLETSFYARDALCCGDQIAGPAVIEQSDTTTVLPPGAFATVDDCGNLHVQFQEAAK